MSVALIYRVVAFVLVLVSAAIYAASAYLRLDVPLGFLLLLSFPVAIAVAQAELSRRASLRLARSADLHLDGSSPPWVWRLGIVLALAVLPGLLLNAEGRLTSASDRPAQMSSLVE